MAAYAALVSLMNNMEHIKNHPLISTTFHKNQIESVEEKLRFLLSFIESYNSNGGNKEAQYVESQIIYAAHWAEDVIESHVVDQLRPEKGRSLLDLHGVIVYMGFIEANVLTVVKENSGSQPEIAYSTPAPKSTTGKHDMVGFHDELVQLMDVLTAQQSTRQIFSITGMGGLGKTTLARTAYENLLISQHFDIRAWVTISQEYDILDILTQLLSLDTKSRETVDETIDKLGVQLHKRLSGRRYLIVLDDMWSSEVWDKIKFYFPDNSNRSRIVITSRLEKVGDDCGSCVFRKKFLEEDVSWILFCERVFGSGQSCPPELERIGREIVRRCRGLPLSVTVMGGLLRKSDRTPAYWKKVAENLSSILNSEEEDCLNTLFLSYLHLPAHLKPCFLYLGSFDEDTEIRVSYLIRRWVAEGFIRSNDAQALEDIAAGYVEDLADRNLVLAGRRSYNGRIKDFRIHDLLRELCLKICEKEHFLCVLSKLDSIPPGIDRERRLVFRDPMYSNDASEARVDAFQSKSLARSLICSLHNDFPVKLRLLRVFIHSKTFDEKLIFQNFNLRYLVSKFYTLGKIALPSSVSLIWNLQTLILSNSYEIMVMPDEIWRMVQFRHIKCTGIDLPDPRGGDLIVLGNLQTLAKPVNFIWSEDVVKRIPNIRRLCLSYQDEYVLDSSYLLNKHSGMPDNRTHYHLNNLCSFTIRFPPFETPPPLPVRYSLSDYALKEDLRLPYSLTKLSLRDSLMQWQDVTIIIGSLPRLQVLKLCSVLGRKWSLVDGQFRSLKSLQVECCDLKSWNAESWHFPVLEKLILRDLSHLEEIPSGMGDILTLQLISVHLDSMAAAISAVKIKEEQYDMGNDDLHIQVVDESFSNREEFRRRVEAEGLSIKDIQFKEKHS